jgi:hypothetical protein
MEQQPEEDGDEEREPEEPQQVEVLEDLVIHD